MKYGLTRHGGTLPPLEFLILLSFEMLIFREDVIVHYQQEAINS